MSLRFPLFALSALALSGCSSAKMSGSMDYGLAPGGQQGIDNARDAVQGGEVPDPADITVEGILNDHDMPIEGDACEQTVCVDLAAGTGWIDAAEQSSVLVQVGYDSNIDPETWVRPDSEFTVVIDVSGSMAEEIAPIQRALRVMADQLTGNDTLAIVVYGSDTAVLLPPVSGSQRGAIDDAIDSLRSAGSTNMEAGLTLAYVTAQQMQQMSEGNRNSRVMLFTDEQPNTGATSIGSFRQIIEDGANEGIGLTMFGIGDGFSSGLAYSIGDLRGGNWKYLATNTEVEQVFTEGFGFLVTPVAYDLFVELQTRSPMEAAYNVQGAGNSSDGSGAVVSMHVSTLFLSSGHGASVLQLQAGGADPSDLRVAEGSLSFETVDGDVRTQEVSADLGDAAGGYQEDAFAQAGTRKAAALVNEGLTAIEICQAYKEHNVRRAAEHAAETDARLTAEAAALDDDDLRSELDFFKKLEHNAGL